MLESSSVIAGGINDVFTLGELCRKPRTHFFSCIRDYQFLFLFYAPFSLGPISAYMSMAWLLITAIPATMPRKQIRRIIYFTTDTLVI